MNAVEAVKANPVLVKVSNPKQVQKQLTQVLRQSKAQSNENSDLELQIAALTSEIGDLE